MVSRISTASFTVYMNSRDVTPWVKNLSVYNARRTLWRSFDVTFSGWAAIEDGASWDIYINTSDTDPRQECVIRNGIVPPESPPRIRFNKSGEITASVSGMDYTWRVANRRPRATIVLSDEPNGMNVEKALEAYVGNDEKVIGRTGVIYGVYTLHDAVKKLFRMAGCDCIIRIPDYKIQPVVIPPESTYWDVAKSLVAPYKPYIYYDRFSNSIWIYDSINEMTGAFRKLILPHEMIDEMSAITLGPLSPKRVILRVNRWL